MHADALRGAPPPLAGDQLEGSFLRGEGPHQQGLQDAFLADRLGESVELGLGKAPPRLECPGTDQLDRNTTLRRRFGNCLDFRFTEQRRKTAAELTPTGPRAHGETTEGAPSPARRKTSAASRI